MLVEAVASHLNAIILDLSVANVEGQMPIQEVRKTGHLKLLHMAFSVAKDPTMQPAVIYIDVYIYVDMMFAGKSYKKKATVTLNHFKLQLYIHLLVNITPGAL